MNYYYWSSLAGWLCPWLFLSNLRMNSLSYWLSYFHILKSLIPTCNIRNFIGPRVDKFIDKFYLVTIWLFFIEIDIPSINWISNYWWVYWIVIESHCTLLNIKNPIENHCSLKRTIGFTHLKCKRNLLSLLPVCTIVYRILVIETVVIVIESFVRYI